MKPTDAKLITVVVCGHRRARFTTPAPPEFIERVRRCGERGERALAIDHTTNVVAARADIARDGQGGQQAPSG